MHGVRRRLLVLLVALGACAPVVREPATTPAAQAPRWLLPGGEPVVTGAEVPGLAGEVDVFDVDRDRMLVRARDGTLAILETRSRGLRVLDGTRLARAGDFAVLVQERDDGTTSMAAIGPRGFGLVELYATRRAGARVTVAGMRGDAVIAVVHTAERALLVEVGIDGVLERPLALEAYQPVPGDAVDHDRMLLIGPEEGRAEGRLVQWHALAWLDLDDLRIVPLPPALGYRRLDGSIATTVTWYRPKDEGFGGCVLRRIPAPGAPCASVVTRQGDVVTTPCGEPPPPDAELVPPPDDVFYIRTR
jgi:hypothetical protein